MLIKKCIEVIKLPIVVAFVLSVVVEVYLHSFWGDRYSKRQGLIFGFILFILDSCVAAEILKKSGFGYLQYSRAILINFFSTIQIAAFFIMLLISLYLINFFISFELSNLSSIVSVPREDDQTMIYFSILIRSFVFFGAELGLYSKDSSKLLPRLFRSLIKIKGRVLLALLVVIFICFLSNYISRYYPLYTGLIDGVSVIILSFFVRPWLFSLFGQIDKQNRSA